MFGPKKYAYSMNIADNNLISESVSKIKMSDIENMFMRRIAKQSFTRQIYT